MAEGKWNETGAGLDTSWVHQLRPGDELKIHERAPGTRRRKNDISGQIMVFERMKTKNIAAVNPKTGDKWTIDAWSVKAWRRGNPDNITKAAESTPYIPNPGGVGELVKGDPILICLSADRSEVGFFEQATGSNIHYRTMSGKRYRSPLKTFVCKLPRDRFRS